jgi:hypothetical protein
MYWATLLGDIFLQTHLVTLAASKALHEVEI